LTSIIPKNTAIVQHCLEDRKELSPESIKEYEKVEALMQHIIKHLDRKYWKIRRGIVPYSPYQKKLMGSILILKQLKLRILLKGKANHPKTKRIQRLAKKYNYINTTSATDLAIVQKKLDEGIREHARFKQVAHEHRWAYLESIAKEYNERDGKGIQHHFKILQHREQCKEHFRQIKISEGKTRGGGVDKVQIDKGGECEIVYDRKIIEKEIMRVNKIKLQQAKDTP
jgi:hypothetical protein